MPPPNHVNGLPSKPDEMPPIVQQPRTPGPCSDAWKRAVAYQEKALQICRHLWPTRSPIDFTISRPMGSLLDFVVRISVSEPKSLSSHERGSGHVQIMNGQSEKRDLPPGNYELRVKTSDPRGLRDEIAMLKFAERHLPVETPVVVHYNLGKTNNPLERPYMVQRSIPGRSLTSVWHFLNPMQKQSLALQMGQLQNQLFRITSNAGGIPHMGMDPNASDPTEITEAGLPSWHEDRSRLMASKLPLQMLYERTKKWADLNRKINPRSDDKEPWNGAAALARRLQHFHTIWGTEPRYHLHHKALFPRNIMVEICTRDHVRITGVLGWNDATFAPAIAACLPPFWLWSAFLWEPTQHEEVNWRHYQFDVAKRSEPTKLLFEKAVGDKFMEYAYAENAHIARRLWRCAYRVLGDPSTDLELENIYVDYTARDDSPTKARAKWTSICKIHGEYGNLKSKPPKP